MQLARRIDRHLCGQRVHRVERRIEANGLEGRHIAAVGVEPEDTIPAGTDDPVEIVGAQEGPARRRLIETAGRQGRTQGRDIRRADGNFRLLPAPGTQRIDHRQPVEIAIGDDMGLEPAPCRWGARRVDDDVVGSDLLIRAGIVDEPVALRRSGLAAGPEIIAAQIAEPGQAAANRVIRRTGRGTPGEQADHENVNDAREPELGLHPPTISLLPNGKAPAAFS